MSNPTVVIVHLKRPPNNLHAWITRCSECGPVGDPEPLLRAADRLVVHQFKHSVDTDEFDAAIAALGPDPEKS